jgi:hypothetical protein
MWGNRTVLLRSNTGYVGLSSGMRGFSLNAVTNISDAYGE